MTTTTVANLPISTRFVTGTFKTAVRPVPAGFQSIVITMSPTTGNPAAPFTGIANPFNDPVNQQITFGILWSWDNGLTFPDAVQRTEVGSANGQWIAAKGTTMTPSIELDIVWDSAAAGIPPASDPANLDPAGFPTSYVAYVTTVGGPINSALVVVENTVP